ncbi:MAG: ATP-dependent helicase [Verrucomicrobiales bacterium]
MREYHLQPRAKSSFQVDYAAELNAQQFEAVTSPPGPALVLAGAGSGKTRTLVYRVTYLVEQGIDPANILLLTFTNKAAREMMERVKQLVPVDVSRIWGGTFHSIGNRILRRHAKQLDYPSSFTIMDREDQTDLLKAVLGDLGWENKDKRYPKAEVLGDIISMAVNTAQDLEAVLEKRYDYFLDQLEPIQKAVAAYEIRKKTTGCMDFDDLLVKTYQLLFNYPEVLALYQKIFHAVLVDEYQDTNRIQAELIDLLVGARQHIMAVGDDAQSIYSWRGADYRNILDFPKRYTEAKVYKIEMNYRSVAPIVQLANASIAENREQFPKELKAVRPAASLLPILAEVTDTNQQSAFVAQRILELQEEGLGLGEIAVLYRAHYHSMEVQMELTRWGIPFSITSGIRFFEQAHVKDVAAFMRFAINPNDEISFKRIILQLPGVGAVTATKAWRQVAGILNGESPAGPLGAAIQSVATSRKAEHAWNQLCHTLDELAPGGEAHPEPWKMIQIVNEAIYDDYLKSKFTNYEARREDLEQLGVYARKFEDVVSFLSQLSLMSNLEANADARSILEEEMVTLSTIHQAKGLEWKVVFLIYLCEGMFPSERSALSEPALEEERRLFYVAVTRAQDELYLTRPVMRYSYGAGAALTNQSRFLAELPAELWEEWNVSDRPQDRSEPF